MNEELIRQCAREAARDYWMKRYEETGSGSAKRLAEFSMEGVSDGAEDVGPAYIAIRLYHARHVAPLVEAARELEAVLTRDIGAGYAGVALLQAALAPFEKGEEEQ